MIWIFVSISPHLLQQKEKNFFNRERKAECVSQFSGAASLVLCCHGLQDLEGGAKSTVAKVSPHVARDISEELILGNLSFHGVF